MISIALRDRLVRQFRRYCFHELQIAPFRHQADWMLASEGLQLTGRPAHPRATRNWLNVRMRDKSIVRMGVEPRPGGVAKVLADLGAYKCGKSWSLGLWAGGFAAVPGGRVDLIGLEYDICSPEFEYLSELLLSDRGLGLPYRTFHNSPKAGRMLIELQNGMRYECRSWNRRDILKGKERDCYVYCLPGDAPVWMGNYTQKPISEVRVGDEVLGWRRGKASDYWRKSQQKASYRADRMVRSRVTATHQTRSTLLEIVTDSGRRIQCTPDHRWQCSSATEKGGGGSYQWKRADEMAIGAQLACANFEDPGDRPEDVSPEIAGWLGGMYDGEGSRTLISQSSTHNAALLDRITDAMEDTGFSPVRQDSKDGTGGVRWLGGRSAAIQFYRWIPSHRFRSQYADQLILGGRFRKTERVVSVLELPCEQDVFCITTETGNFIAYGAMSHNCEAYMLPGLSAYTNFQQNLRMRKGWAAFTTTADRPWVTVFHEEGHGKRPDWHCTCNIHARENPYTFVQADYDRDDPEGGGLMTREQFAVSWKGQLGEFVGRVYEYQRGDRLFTPDSHPEWWKIENDRLEREA